MIMMTIENIKMVIMDTGEHILGFVADPDAEDAVIIEKPVSLVPDPSSEGRSMMFIPYLQFTVEETAPFPRRGIRHILTPQPQLCDGYYKQFGSGLILPEGGLSLV